MTTASSTVVTVGIPCRNAERWIGGAIQSALGQSGVQPDVIVIDDGSEDGSCGIIESFGSAIRVVRTPPRGAPAARNAALELARGEWIQFLDADDYLLPEKVRTQIDEGAGFDPGTVPYSPVLAEFWRNDRVVSRSADLIDPVLDVVSQWLLWQMPQTSGAVWPVRVLKEIGGWNPKQPYCQEHELYLRALCRGVRFGFTPSALAVYRLWSQETLCRKDPVGVIHVRAGLIGEMLEWLGRTGQLCARHQEHAARTLFESARSLAAHDLAAACAFHDQWSQQRLIRPDGPAAPALYRLVYHLLGFRNAEKLAALRR